jgi:predicted DCC family thiol-disulfide oxidoreductase YuxK
MGQIQLTLFFDGRCAFCVAGMKRLRRWDIKEKLAFIDISDPLFLAEKWGLNQPMLEQSLHALTEEGNVILGIEAIYMAYALVGQGWRVCLLRVKGLRFLWVKLYRVLAKYRYQLSLWLGYMNVNKCSEGVCDLKSKLL